MSIPKELEDQFDPEEVFEFDCTPEELAEALFPPDKNKRDLQLEYEIE